MNSHNESDDLFQSGGKNVAKTPKSKTPRSKASAKSATGSKASAKAAPRSRTSKSSSGSKAKTAEGGALMDDVKNLAVPFAILLAKQGLQHMFDSSKKKTSSDSPASFVSPASPKSALKSASKSAKTGGSCGYQCADAVSSKTGGTSASQLVKSRFQKLSKEIDEFLQKY